MSQKRKNMQELDDSLIHHLTKEEKAQALDKYQFRSEEVLRVGLAKEELAKQHQNKLLSVLILYSTSIGFNANWEQWLNKAAFFDGASLNLNIEQLRDLAGDETNKIQAWLERAMAVLERKREIFYKQAGIPISEQVQLVEWEKQIYSLLLNEYEVQQGKQLIAERDSAKDLASFKAGVEETIFGELPHAIRKNNGHILWLNSFRLWNLKTVIERYDEGKKYCTSQEAMQEYTQQELDNFKQGKSTFLQKYDFNEYYNTGEIVPEIETVSKVKRSKRIIINNIWVSMLKAFTQHVEKDLVNKKKVSEENSKKRVLREAKLHADITAVQQLLSRVGMGAIYDAPGEWVAALRGLFVGQILTGSAASITRWAVKQGYIEQGTGELIKKAWAEEKGQDSDFTNDNQKVVFSRISKEARKLLDNK